MNNYSKLGLAALAVIIIVLILWITGVFGGAEMSSHIFSGGDTVGNVWNRPAYIDSTGTSQPEQPASNCIIATALSHCGSNRTAFDYSNYRYGVTSVGTIPQTIEARAAEGNHPPLLGEPSNLAGIITLSDAVRNANADTVNAAGITGTNFNLYSRTPQETTANTLRTNNTETIHLCCTTIPDARKADEALNHEFMSHKNTVLMGRNAEIARILLLQAELQRRIGVAGDDLRAARTAAAEFTNIKRHHDFGQQSQIRA